MKKSYWPFCLFAILLVSACGDAGIGFNVSKKKPLNFHVIIPGNDPTILTNPPTSNSQYRLDDVGDFKGFLTDLASTGGIEVNQITYDITEVSVSEEVSIDNINLRVTSSGAEDISLLNISGKLQNTSETNTGINDQNLQEIADILANYQVVDNTLIFNFSTIPASDLDFVFTLYYDVTIRVRY